MQYVHVPVIAASKEKDVPYKKGNRLLVKVEKDQAFLGTVTRVANGQIYLLFDNGTKGSVALKSRRILGVGIKRTVKKAIDPKHAQNYLVESKTNPPKPKKKKQPSAADDDNQPQGGTSDNPYNNPKAQLRKPNQKLNDKPKKVPYSSLQEMSFYRLKVENDDGDAQVADAAVVYRDNKNVYAIYKDKYGYIVLSPVKPSTTALTLDNPTIYRLNDLLSNSLINAYNKYCKIKYGKEKGDEYQALQVARSLARLNLSRSGKNG